MVRVGFPGGPRLEWFDRNPQPVSQGWVGSGIGPHSITTRFTYTVPTGKKVFLENAVAMITRRLAATTAALVAATVGARALILLDTLLFTNGVGDGDRMNVGRNIIMQAAEVLSGTTVDGSVGGTVDYLLMAHGIEFDA